MAEHTINIDVIDKSIPIKNPRTIPVINKPNPCYNYSANAKEVWYLIRIPQYYIYEAGTKNIITGSNYYTYFPEEEHGGGGGITPEEVRDMIVAAIDPSVSAYSENAVQNKAIKGYVDNALISKANLSDLADVATSGSYDDLVNKPIVDSAISTSSTNAVQNATMTNFVNSSIETATAEFKGTFETKAAMDAVIGNKNDYAFLIVKNADNTVNHYERYKWVEVPIDGSNWVFEYNLNNSSYTAEQWAAINSGIKPSNVSQIDTNTSDISDLKNKKVDKVAGKGLSTNDFTDEYKDQMSQIDINTVSIEHLKRVLDGTMISRYIDYDKPKMSLIAGDVSRFKVFQMMKRCNVDTDGTIKCYYGDSEYVEDGSNGDVMVYLKKFYYKREILEASPIGDVLGGYHIKKEICSISDYPLGGYKCHPLFMNESGNEVDHILVSAFEGCAYDVSESKFNLTDVQNVDFVATTGDKLMSIAGAKPMSGLSQSGCTRPNCEQLAKNKGAGWHQWNVKLASALQMLHLVEFGPNSQVLTGEGVVSYTDMSAYNCASYTGSTVGNTTGSAATTYSEIAGEGHSQVYTAGSKNPHTNAGFVSVSYRGIENPWGNIWSFISGMNIWGDGAMRGGQPYICKDFNYVESKNSGNYEGVGFTTIASGGYIKYFGFGKEEYDWLFIGSGTDVSENGMIGDYNWITSDLNGYRIALLGGRWINGSQAGLFCWSLDLGVGVRSRNIGARDMFIPQNA